MGQRYLLLAWLSIGLLIASAAAASAQNAQSDVTIVHITVNMVQLDVAVTDNKGRYVTGLGPENFEVFEDGIREKIAAFGEENGVPRSVHYSGPGGKVLQLGKYVVDGAPGSNSIIPSSAGASVFVLFDTSNYMYRGFALARDAIVQFVRSLDRSDRVAFYSYSRDFFRASPLSEKPAQVLEAVRTTVAGDDAALYNALLWTLKDADKFSGRRVVVVFSNGPDDASMVSPEDVRELAQSEGIPIYMISTRQAERDPLSTAVFKRISTSTGGKAYFAGHWQDQEKAFASIRADLAHLYTISYYPATNPNTGWRKITVEVKGKKPKNYNIRTRTGYRPRVLPETTETMPINTAPPPKGMDRK
ncbi:MAG: VWA domain-containing protein [Acidobacteria bacterium]|nr:MAG: VWA domain-containing protein [Acidobacteriota bacterium]